jgi:hypothetical protein
MSLSSIRNNLNFFTWLAEEFTSCQLSQLQVTELIEYRVKKIDMITNENIYFENYYDEQRKFERII